MSGTVYLVGAGPGDPGLMTVRGRALLAQADCVIYDYLANPQLLDEIPAQAERFYVGKIAGTDYPWKQSAINELLLTQAHAHRCVVRLKGGDPLCFGRGGEEAMLLRAHGIRFEMVPGVTAGLAVPCYAGIPVTHRDHASSVVFLTGREKQGKERSAHDWDALAGIGTLVIYMGVSKLATISAELISRGRAPDTPAAFIQWGTYERQRVLVATLATIAAEAEAGGYGSPAIVVIGEVVNCRETMAWYDQRPLFGRRVVVTRASERQSRLATLLREQGATVLEWPAARFVAADTAVLDAATSALATHEWVCFTSPKAVAFLTAHLRQQQRDARVFGSCQVAAVGASTAAALADFGLRADLVPERYDADHLARDLLARAAGSVLLPQADNARPQLRDTLQGAGLQVTALATYRAEAIGERHEVSEAAIDCVTFTSAATVDRFLAQVGPAGRRQLIDRGCAFIAIGAQTGAAVTAAGLPLTRLAAQASLPDLVTAVVEQFS